MLSLGVPHLEKHARPKRGKLLAQVECDFFQRLVVSAGIYRVVEKVVDDGVSFRIGGIRGNLCFCVYCLEAGPFGYAGAQCAKPRAKRFDLAERLVRILKFYAVDRGDREAPSRRKFDQPAGS